MGNCIETCKNSPKLELNHQQKERQQQQSHADKSSELQKENKFEKSDEKSGGMRIKIVLTKEELELLLLQLKNEEGKKIEDVLDEIERSRRRSVGPWKPSLESITESPEVPEQMDR